MIRRQKLTNILNQLLEPHAIKDYCPNGLQVEGRDEIRKIVTGVTASQGLLDAAVAEGADAILVHHGYFWKGEAEVVTGMKQRRLKTLLTHDINLFAYHLPLDVHPELGNNAQLAKLLGIRVRRGLEPWDKKSVAMVGKFDEPLSGEALAARIGERLGRTVLHCGESGPALIETVAWCTGGGQSYINLAAEQGIDAFISGEASEQTIHTAREMGMHFFAAGHHATERYGVKALGEWLATEHGVEVIFVDIDNPV
ncbi:dinuclear metal center YbgI/SA1388 family protein [Aeromonas sp. BIGb0405]|jgi:dinuclear metal center YbgI/SA1388 family protein|uniref:Nif3-like dinuclear metal center hexameric protein n=1 Tax=Aeromonas TaxID=642 RepID=UPI001CCA3766|nr:dinuclear metal center YbgI/SA1388 family protein [Aeromonas sp. BIGb0405]MCS3458449.1 dinuclear metal center YbgI/SA1388 family protein [Aeromonas sp. BIGb0445]UBO72811.1 Nif3-like dinuclear metal center hexameric protein [Aeromonas rivuli]